MRLVVGESVDQSMIKSGGRGGGLGHCGSANPVVNKPGVQAAKLSSTAVCLIVTIETLRRSIPMNLSDRRRFLTAGVATASGLAMPSVWNPGVYADQLSATAKMTEGPFYPDALPLDTDNDLIIVNDSLTPAVGELTYLSGRVLTPAGSPIAGAHVEIWQCDAAGIYMHSRDKRTANRDSNFQSYGRFITDRAGRYFFRTIKPVQYSGRTPHIHYAVSKNGHRILTTQMLILGEPRNQTDFVFQRIAPEQQSTVLAEFRAAPDPAVAMWEVGFDLVIGRTKTVED